MSAVRPDEIGILADSRCEEREELLHLLAQAYWMEMESVMNYVACSVNPDGLRAQEVVEALAKDVDEELSHARRFARRIKELYGVVPGSLGFVASQDYLQPPEDQTDLAQVIEGVIRAELGAIGHYERIVEYCEGLDLVTQDLVLEVLHEEQGHLRLFEGFLREVAPNRFRPPGYRAKERGA
jgi:bacterioferritin